MRINKKRTSRIVANDEVINEVADVEVAPEVGSLLFEAEDVAELVAEITGEDVAVDADEETGDVVFTVADEEFTVSADGDEEIVEGSKRLSRNARPVRASRRAATRKAPVKASTRAARTARPAARPATRASRTNRK